MAWEVCGDEYGDVSGWSYSASGLTYVASISFEMSPEGAVTFDARGRSDLVDLMECHEFSTLAEAKAAVEAAYPDGAVFPKKPHKPTLLLRQEGYAFLRTPRVVARVTNV